MKYKSLLISFGVAYGYYADYTALPLIFSCNSLHFVSLNYNA